MKHTLGLGDLRHRSESLKSNRSSTESIEPVTEDTTIVEPDQGNVLSHIISQLRPGADLSRVTLPTFILEERSMLERITNFMAHPDTLLPMPEVDDPVERFVAVVKYYLSGWHIKPPGVKKPLNPILGETFTCYWDYPDGTRGYYIAEQTSHHPPKSSYFFIAPDHHIRVDGCLKPRSRFLGNSAASLMEGVSYLRFMNRGASPGGEKYILTQPNMYARGILFGKMKYELGDHSVVRCPENNLSADLEFKTKGWVGGTYNAIGGYIKNDKTGESLYELSGLWSGEMFIKDLKTGQKTLLFDATHAKHSPPLTRPFAEQGDRESQKLWREVCKAVHVMDHDRATTEKSKIEDRQREEAKKREESGEQWQPKLFRKVDPTAGEDDLEWVIDVDINRDTSPDAITKQVLDITPVIPGQISGSGLPPNQPTDSSAPSNSTTQAANKPQPDNLIDFDSEPTNATNASSQHPPTNSAQQPSITNSAAGNKSAQPNLLDDDTGLGGKMNSMSIQEPTKPSSPPIQRTDTETSEIDVFVDANS